MPNCKTLGWKVPGQKQLRSINCIAVVQTGAIGIKRALRKIVRHFCWAPEQGQSMGAALGGEKCCWRVKRAVDQAPVLQSLFPGAAVVIGTSVQREEPSEPRQRQQREILT